MHSFLILQMGRAGKQVVREGSDEDDVPLAQRKRKGGASSQAPHGHGRTNHQLLPVNPRDKVIVPVQSKLTNPMITMMIMRTFLWTPSLLSSFGHPSLLVRLLKWELSGWWIT
jgi:hypothetical protein